MQHTLKSIRSLVRAGCLTVSALVFASAASAESEVDVKDGVAAQGYDVVAYFTEGKPVEGNASHSTVHEGATYHFASKANLEQFASNPGKYAPQYGGYCAFGTAMGRKFSGDPLVWTIRDDKLYLNLNEGVKARWSEDIPGFIRGADNNWPLIRSLADSSLASSAPAGVTQGAQ